MRYSHESNVYRIVASFLVHSSLSGPYVGHRSKLQLSFFLKPSDNVGAITLCLRPDKTDLAEKSRGRRRQSHTKCSDYLMVADTFPPWRLDCMTAIRGVLCPAVWRTKSNHRSYYSAFSNILNYYMQA